MSIDQIVTGAAGRGTVARMPTSAERGFAEGFEAIAGSLPGEGWVKRIRQKAIAAFAARGLPSRRVEAFKYTDLRERVREAFAPATAGADVSGDAIEAALGALAGLDAHRLVFVDGRYRAELSSCDGLAESAEFMALAPLLDKAPAWLEGKFAAGRLISGEDAIASLNAAYMSDGLLIKIKPGHSASKPVMIVNAVASPTPASVMTRNIVAIETGASLTLIEADVALPGAATQGLGNLLTDVTVADGACLDHIKVVRDVAQSTRLALVSAEVGSDAVYRAFVLVSGGRLVRHQLGVRLGGPGSKLDISGAFLARGTSHVDTTLLVDHAAVGCESRELFKGVLDDRARGVFQGKIIVRPGAVKTDGKQMARVLMLSEDAEFDSKPELEIFADDVACGHGATTSEINPDLLFYCLSRGIPEAEARALLIEAFIGEAIEKVEDEAVRSALMDEARAWFLRERAAASERV